MKKTLTRYEIIDYVNSHTTVFLTKPNQSTHEVLAADYIAATQGSLYLFNIGRNESTLFIDCSSIEEVFAENGDIHFQTNDGLWVLHAEEEVFDFNPDDNEMLKPHELDACLKRARNLEAFLNDQLYLIKIDYAMVHVDFKIDIESHYEEPRRCGRIEFRSKPTYKYYFDIFVGDLDLDKIYIKDIVQDIDVTNERAFRALTRDLLKKLLPTDIVLYVDYLASESNESEPVSDGSTKNAPSPSSHWFSTKG